MSGKPGNVAMGNLLAAWNSGKQKTTEEIGKAFETLDVCGGAYLFLTRQQAGTLEAGGLHFDADPHRTIPIEGRGPVRVRCRQPIAIKVILDEMDPGDGSPPKVRRGEMKLGLCDRCETLETGVRKRARVAAKEAAQKASTGTRKRGFREDAAE